MNKFVYWTPRIVSLLFVVFISLFALDAFADGFSFKALLGFAIHLLPSFILLAVIMIAWRYELVGAVLFSAFGLYYIWSVGFSRHWSWYASIAAPALLVGILYFFSWRQKRKARVITQ